MNQIIIPSKYVLNNTTIKKLKLSKTIKEQQKVMCNSVWNREWCENATVSGSNCGFCLFDTVSPTNKEEFKSWVESKI